MFKKEESEKLFTSKGLKRTLTLGMGYKQILNCKRKQPPDEFLY